MSKTSVQHVISLFEIAHEIVYFFSYLFFEIWCVFYTYSTSQFGLATFQVFHCHMGLVDITLDSTVLECLFLMLLWGKYLLSLKAHPGHLLQEAVLTLLFSPPRQGERFCSMQPPGWGCCIASTTVYFECLTTLLDRDFSVSVSQWMVSNLRTGRMPIHLDTLSASILYMFCKWLLSKWMDVVSGIRVMSSIPFHGHFF